MIVNYDSRVVPDKKIAYIRYDRRVINYDHGAFIRLVNETDFADVKKECTYKVGNYNLTFLSTHTIPKGEITPNQTHLMVRTILSHWLLLLTSNFDSNPQPSVWIDAMTRIHFDNLPRVKVINKFQRTI